MIRIIIQILVFEEEIKCIQSILELRRHRLDKIFTALKGNIVPICLSINDFAHLADN